MPLIIQNMNYLDNYSTMIFCHTALNWFTYTGLVRDQRRRKERFLSKKSRSDGCCSNGFYF